MKQEDLFRAVGGVDDALIEEFETEKPHDRKWMRYGALAACVCLVAVGGLLWLRPNRAPAPVETPTVSAPSVSAEAPTPTAPEHPAPTPIDTLPKLAYAEGGGELAADIALPDGYFYRPLTQEAMASIWGLKTLSWEGLLPSESYSELGGISLEGELTYDGTGRVWLAAIRGTVADSKFLITLSPEQVPVTCIAYDGGDATCEIYGTPVTALRFGDHTEITFLRGEGESAVGMRLETNDPSEAVEELFTRIVSQSLRPDGVLQLDQLKTDEIPEWRSETLTEAQARAEAGFGEYLPETLPAGYAFEAAYRELGENRNYLSASWFYGYDNLSVTVYKDGDVRGLVHADEIEKYDEDYYGKEKPDVPEEYWESWQSPIFYAEELTMEVIQRRVSEVDMGNVYTHFGVLYPDGTVVHVSASADEETLPALLAFLMAK